MFIAALFIIIKNYKHSKCQLLGNWINKMWYIHTMEVFSNKKKNCGYIVHGQSLRTVWYVKEITCKRLHKV